MDISAAAAPRADQINADDALSGPIMVTIAEVRRGSDEQPVNIITEEFGPQRPYKPCKSMIRVLIAGWGKDASVYAGRRLMLYRDADVRFGKDAVGGLRISAMSDIPSRLTLALTVTRGRRAPFIVEPLPDAPPAISTDDVAEFEVSIANAQTLDDLSNIGADLKTWNLGQHRQHLQDAWSRRKTEIEAGGTE